MSYPINNQQKLNEIIFADRNKNYGAYLLRSTYGNTIFKSLSLMLLGVSSVMLLAYYLINKNNINPDQASGQLVIHDSIYVIPFNKQPEEPVQIKKKSTDQKPQETETSVENKSVTVVDSTIFEKIVTSTTSALSSHTGSSATAPVEPGNNGNGPVTKATGNGTLNSGPMEGYRVDSQPEFEGGLSALYRFVSSHLKYPLRASEEGIEGTVYVRFVVDETGKVGNLSLLNNLGYGLDDEALRVVAMIPKFKSPAKANGEAVKVYFQLPIKFISR